MRGQCAVTARSSCQSPGACTAAAPATAASLMAALAGKCEHNGKNVSECRFKLVFFLKNITNIEDNDREAASRAGPAASFLSAVTLFATRPFVLRLSAPLTFVLAL